MKKETLLLFVIMTICSLSHAQKEITINPNEEIRPIGMMNGVNGGPAGMVTPELFKAAGIPFARLHDIGNTEKHCVEIMQIFPDFKADENKEESYDFTITDQFVKRLHDTGTKIIWRLANGGHEPSLAKKYAAWPPKDFKKWASICEHVVRHYNDGWANGFHYNIQYWEIWNEPDIDQKSKVGDKFRYEVAPHAWGGTLEQHYKLFETTFKHLKKTHPDLKIGGPAHAFFWANEPFIQHMKAVGVKPDFFSWHHYDCHPEGMSKLGRQVRELLDKYGWNDVISVLDEWNYVTEWSSKGEEYSLKVRKSIKGAAFVSAVFCHMQQEACVDILNYYDFRRYGTSYNGAFNMETRKETSTYYSFYNWKKLHDYGTQIKTECQEKDIYTVAAKSTNGKIRLLISRFNDEEVREDKTIYVTLPEGCSEAVCTLNDTYHLNTEYPIDIDSQNRIRLSLEPNSIAFIDFR